MEKTFLLDVGMCCCLQTCSLVVNMMMMGLVLGEKFDGHIYHWYPVTCKIVA